ncbi:methyl-accepting chemotaxis protein [Planctomycetales bacterium]|nr:methyl-accepting chemotaxis protein [Planctomycetales bacterium]
MKLGIQIKLQLLVVIITSILTVSQVVLSQRHFSRFVEEESNAQVKRTVEILKKDIDYVSALATEQTRSLAFSSSVERAIKANDREGLFKVFDNYKADIKVDFFTVLDMEGKVIIRSSSREKFGDKLESPSIEAALKGQSICGYESTKGIPLSIRAGAPIYDPDDDNKQIGVLTCGFRCDTDNWVKGIAAKYDVEVTTFVGKTRNVTTIINPKTGEPAVGTDLTDPAIIKCLFEDKKIFEGYTTIFGNKYEVLYIPAMDAKGKTLGIIFAGYPLYRDYALVAENLRTNLIILVIGLAVFIIILYVFTSYIVRPIHKMTKAAELLERGELDIDLNVNTNDELQVLSEAFIRVADSLKIKSKVAIEIANGNLTTWVPLSSPHDTLGIAFIQMRYAFYDSVKDLTSLVGAIRKEGSQLTQVNERLVSNSSKTSSELENVTAVVDELNADTKSNSENSVTAEQYTKEATSGTVQGGEKMKRMVEAMNGITKSSHEIKNIIRVIDDIAFQTNLLALNAAVEAARAGTHGKGFAVVAEEVRNLAARSAKAAKETADLIEESIRQVESGSNVASETSESLNRIAEHVSEINGIISKIKDAAGSQAAKFAEANDALRQVSEASQQNTAACSEAAEAVSQLTNTAQRLNTIVSHFHINDGGQVTKPAGDPGFLPSPEPKRIQLS